LSPSSSPSPSIGLGYTKYSREAAVTLPSDDADLSTLYTAAEVQKVSLIDGIFVDIGATDEYMIHEYKDFIDISTSIQINWRGKSTQDASKSPIFMQIYDRGAAGWVTIAQDISAAASADVTLKAVIDDTTPYIDSHDVIASRIYQEAV